MAKTFVNLQVLVGYPDDVAEERAILDEIVEELNITWSRTLGIRLEVIDWKTHAWPNFGEDAQSVINDEIGESYDIFLGIMWMRFGEPTPRAGSGTAEEFHRALARFKRNPQGVRIMFYFKETPPNSLKDIDAEQLTLIRGFKAMVAKEGGLYSEFSNKEQFASAVRLHLSRQAQEYGNTWGLEPAETSTAVSERINPEPVTQSDEEEGFLDLVERTEEDLQAATNILDTINLAQTKSSATLKERTAELNDLNKVNADTKQRKRVLNAMADAMDEFSFTLEGEVPKLSKHYSSAMDAMTRSVSIWNEDLRSGEDQVANAYRQLQAMLLVQKEYLPTVLSVREVVSAMPRVTSEFNRSKRRLISAIDLQTQEIQNEIELGNQLLAHLESILRDSTET